MLGEDGEDLLDLLAKLGDVLQHSRVFLLCVGQTLYLVGQRLDVAAQAVDVDGEGRDGRGSLATLWFGQLRSPDSVGGSHGLRGRGMNPSPGGSGGRGVSGVLLHVGEACGPWVPHWPARLSGLAGWCCG
ncbi:MAG: hypothetical protein ACM3ML_14765, partial [Micromonosporaceae bacterium]